MTNAPSIDVKDELVTAGIGIFAASSGWGIYVSKMPSSPDQTITIFDRGGADPNPRFLLDNSSVQIIVRGSVNDYVATYVKSQEIKDHLLGLGDVTLNGTRYVGFWQQGDIIHVGYDDNDRPLFSLNWRIVREPSTPTNRVPA